MDLDNKSLAELLEIAKRAQDIIARLDLEAVSKHDPAEVSKLKRIADAVTALDNGEQVDFVPGVDEDETVMPVIDPAKARASALLALLERQGYSERLGRVFVAGIAEPLKPLAYVPHLDGLPEFDMCVAPEWSPVDGAHAVLVSERGVFAALVPTPVDENRWRIMRSAPYESESEMLTVLRRYLEKPELGEF
jgi:hypothetical protein